MKVLGWYADATIQTTFVLIFHLLEEANAQASGEDFLSRYIGDLFRCNRLLHLLWVKQDACS
jgi:hypothetical protein